MLSWNGMVDVVLIVEDERAARTGMEKILQLAGYAPVSAATGQEQRSLQAPGRAVNTNGVWRGGWPHRRPQGCGRL